MSDEAPEATTTDQQPDAPAEAKKPDTQPAEHMVPKSRLDEVLGKLRTLEKEQTKRQQEAEAAEQKRLEEEQKWQQLAEKRAQELEKLTPVQERAEAYESALRRFLDREREGLPEHIISLLDGRPVTEQLEWLADNRDAVLAKPKAPPDVNGPDGGRETQTKDDAEIREIAARLNVSEKYLREYYKVN